MSLDLSATTTKLLRKLAATSESQYVQIKRETGGGVDDYGEYTAGTSELIGLNAAVTQMPKNMVDGTRILATDLLVVTDKLIPINFNDRVLIDGVKHTIISIDAKNHSGTVQAQFIGARL